MTQETKLGIFVIISAICLVISIILLGNFQFQRTWEFNILFNDVAGLPEKSRIKIAGVEVGVVKKITLEGNRARVTASLRRGIPVHADAEARIGSTGFIGSKFLELTMGSADKPPLEPGATIIGVEPMSFDKTISQVMAKIDTLVASFEGQNIGENLGATLANLRRITESLSTALADQQDKLVNIVGNVDQFTGDLAEITRNNKEDVKVALHDIRTASEKLDRILARIDQGEGTIGKLISDKEMGENLKVTVADLRESVGQAKKVLRRLNLIETHWDYTLRYDQRYEYARSDFGLRIIPQPGKFYYLGGSNLGDNADATADPEKKNTINALIGREFGPLTVYGGVIRSKGGLGASVKPFYKWEPWRRLEFTVDAYDFGREAPVKKAKVNAGARVKVTRWASVGAQLEDMYHTSSVNTYVNFDIRDDDIAYILGLVGLAKP